MFLSERMHSAYHQIARNSLTSWGVDNESDAGYLLAALVCLPDVLNNLLVRLIIDASIDRELCNDRIVWVHLVDRLLYLLELCERCHFRYVKFNNVINSKVILN